jgi:hypothetical protein
MAGNSRGTLSRWIQRRSAILAVIFAVVVLPVLPTGAATWAGELADSTAASRLGRSQPEPQFKVSPDPNSAGPGDSVTVSFSSPDPNVTITGCTAGFSGGDTRHCPIFRRSVTLQVPADAAPGPLTIRTAVAYSMSDPVEPSGVVRGEVTVPVPFTVVLPPTTTAEPTTTTEPPTTTTEPPTTVVPSTTGVPPTTGVSPTIPPGIIPIGGTSNLWLLLVVLVLVLLALTAALVGRRSRPRPRPAARVQARLRDGPPPVPRIEQISKRPAWVLRIDPHRDRATERVEEMQR